MMQSTARRLAAPMLMVALGLTACSSSGGTPTAAGSGGTGTAAAPGVSASSGATTSSGAGGASAAAYLNCLGSNGVKLTADGKQIDKNANTQAQEDAGFKACKSLEPAVQADPAKVKAAKKVTDCMRSSGFKDYPEPDAAGNINPSGAVADELKSSPKAIAALKKCAPSSGGGGTTVNGG
ncbi:hypothetical protein [Streptacidiphilus sp. PAMC 29251]